MYAYIYMYIYAFIVYKEMQNWLLNINRLD